MLFIDLNDDILMEIFKHLDLNQQLVMKGLSERFIPLVNRVWRSKYKIVHLNTVIHMAFLHIQHTERFFLASLISETVQEMSVDQHDAINNETPIEEHLRFGFLLNHTFPRLKTLNYTVDYDFPDIIDFATIFPALKELSISWNPGLHYTPLIKESIKTLVNCKHLEELHCIGSYRPEMTDVLFRLLMDAPRLEKLTFQKDVCGMLTKIADTPLALRVHTFPTLTKMSSDIFSRLIKLQNLRALSTKDECCDSQVLKSIVASLPNLEEIIYHVMWIESSERFDSQMRAIEDAVREQVRSDRRNHHLNFIFYTHVEYASNPEKTVHLTKFLTVNFLNCTEFLETDELILTPKEDQ